MAVQVNPITPSLPATTAIQDPAARRFAQAVSDAIRVSQTPEYAIKQLASAADGLFGGSTPPSILQWLLSSELYQNLSRAIDRVDIAAKIAIVEEQEARVQAIADEAAARANEISAEALARIAAVQAEADARAQALLDEAVTRGAEISSAVTILQSADESLAESITLLTAAVGDNAAAIENEQSARVDAVAAEANSRETLAAQIRGDHTGNDLDAITSGLLYQERIARATAVDGLAQQITLLSAGAGEQFDYKHIWYFDAGDDGWTGNGTPSVSAGWIRPANHATDPHIISPVGISANGSTYTQVRMRIRKIGSPTWAGVLWWRTDGDSTWDAARSEALTEPTYDGNGIGIVTVNLTWVGVIDRIRIDLSTAQSATDGFEVDWVAVGRPSPGASSAALLTEQLARANADAAEVTARESLSTKVTGAANPSSLTLATLSSGLLFDERQARSSADTVEVTARQALSAKITGFNDPAGKSLVDLTAGLLYEEKTARATQDTALAQDISTLTARVGDAEGAIVSEETARASADEAIANSVSGLTAQFGGNLTYSVLKQWEFASTVEGWAVVAATATVSNGILTLTTTGANPYINFTFATADRYMGSIASKIRARIRRTAGSQAWEGRAYYTTAGHSWSDSYRKSIAAPVAASEWTILEWDMSALSAGGSDYVSNEIRGIRLDLVGTAGDTWQIDWISVGERVASPAALDAQENKAAITAEETARANADGALATSISTLRSQVGVTEGGALTTGLILEEKNVRASNDNAIVSAVNTALAQITGVSTSISQSGENLISSWTEASATKWSQIESEVLTAGGQTVRAALAQESLTRANQTGDLYAQYTVKLDTNGYVAGFGLASESSAAGVGTSSFIIRADKFVMTMPGYGDYVPFAIGTFGPSLLGSGGFSVAVDSVVNKAAQPENFLETFESGSASQWTNHGGLGEVSVVDDSTSLSGGKVLRVGNNSGNDQGWLIHKQNIPFDPNALYRVKARVRRTAGTGTLYVGVAGVAADGTTFVTASGGTGTSSQHYFAASGQNPSSSWTEYVGYFRGSAASGNGSSNNSISSPGTVHTNVRYIRPLLLLNYPSATGTMEVDYCSIEKLTDAMNWDSVTGAGKDALVTQADTANTNASTALDKLADIASDSKLTSVEKKSVKKEWDAIVAEKSGINTQASGFGITTENTNYNNAYNTLSSYITPLLSDLTTPSNITGSTFRSNFSSFYSARQSLLNKIAAVASTKAVWSQIAGAGDTGNLMPDVNFEDPSWGNVTGDWAVDVPTTLTFPKALRWVAPSKTAAAGATWLGEKVTPPALLAPVVPGEKVYFSAQYATEGTATGTAQLYLRTFDKNKTVITAAAVAANLTIPSATAAVAKGSYVIPAGVAYVGFYFRRGASTSGGTATGWVEWAQARLSRTEDGATVGAPAGTLVGSVAAEAVATAITNFNSANDRNGSAITAPTILTDGTAVDHTLQKDGSADISFEWAWAGTEGDIDGFLVYVRQSASSSAYAFGTTPAEETVYTVPATKRAFILFGVAADRYYTFGVQAYRAVDKDINAAGAIKSTLVKATGTGENPYRPSATVAFSGDVTGTIDGTLASTLVSNASTALSNANAAQEDATEALSKLTDIAADNKLTPAEKKSVRKEWDAIYAERAGILAQADLFATPSTNGVATAKANYESDFQTLGTYLNGGTAYTIGATPPLWIKDATNLSTTTDITGATFRNHWKNLYADRQALLNKIAVEASKRADWDQTAGKPTDEDILNTSNPLNKNPDLLGSANADTTAPRWTRVVSGAPAEARIAVGDYGLPIKRNNSQVFYAKMPSGATTGSVYWVSEVFDIDETKDHCLSIWARKYGSTGAPMVYYRIRCYDRNNVDLGTIALWSGSTTALSTQTFKQYYKTINAADFPSLNGEHTAKVRIEWYGDYATSTTPGTGCGSMATRLMLNEGRVPTKNMGIQEVDIDAHLTRAGTSVAATDLLASWNKISTTNAANFFDLSGLPGTYITNLSVGKLVAGALGVNQWISSTNYVTGASGWAINANGSAEFRDVVVRGDVEASTLKANAVNIVSTLNIAGNAVTIPIAANGGSTVTTASADFASSPVVIIGQTSASSSDNNWRTVYLHLYRVTGGTESALKVVPAGRARGSSDDFQLASGAIVFKDNPGGGSHAYKLYVSTSDALINSGGLSGVQSSIVALGVKR